MRSTRDDFASRTWRASDSIVGASNKVRTPKSIASAALTSAITFVAISEFPPSSKKSSPAPTVSTPRTSAKISASSSSSAPSGGRKLSDRASNRGAGKAARSTFPAGVTGNSSSRTNAAGTMYDGTRLATYRVSSAVESALPPAGTTYVVIIAVPEGAARATVTAFSTCGHDRTTLSISPSSIRNPRTFTWKSLRPTYSSPRPRRHRTKSPVRYIRCPGRPKGSATNRSAVNAYFR